MRHIGEVQLELTELLQASKYSMQCGLDIGVKQTPQQNIGDQVWLSSKFGHGWLGPLAIFKSLPRSAYNQEFSLFMKGVHPVLHVSILQKHKEDSIMEQKLTPPKYMEVYWKGEQEVKSILNFRHCFKNIKYLHHQNIGYLKVYTPRWPWMAGLYQLEPKGLIQGIFFALINSLDFSFLGATVQGHLGFGDTREPFWKYFSAEKNLEPSKTRGNPRTDWIILSTEVWVWFWITRHFLKTPWRARREKMRQYRFLPMYNFNSCHRNSAELWRG